MKKFILIVIWSLTLWVFAWCEGEPMEEGNDIEPENGMEDPMDDLDDVDIDDPMDDYDDPSDNPMDDVDDFEDPMDEGEIDFD